MYRKQAPRAFTLIELLVVIAIIAILAAILFPVFSQAKAAAKKSADLSNFNQIGKAIMLYANDNDDCSMVVDHEAGYGWYEPLYPYVKSNDVFRTPAYSRVQVEDDEGNIVIPETDYSMNGLFAHGTSLTSNSSPAQQIIVALRNRNFAEAGYHPWPESAEDDASTPDWNNLDLYVGAEHGGTPEDWFRSHIDMAPWQGGSNFAFLDGHSKFYKWEQTVQGQLPGFHNVDRALIHHHDD